MKNFKNMTAVGELINKINQNDTLYESYLEHKLYSKISNSKLYREILQDHPVPSFECYVCERIHQEEKYKKKPSQNVYKCSKPSTKDHNTWYQHWDIGKCQAKALAYLMEKKVPYSEEEFEEVWREFCYYDHK